MSSRGSWLPKIKTQLSTHDGAKPELNSQCPYQRPSQGEGVTPRTCLGMTRDLLTRLVANFKPGMGEYWITFVLLKQDPRPGMTRGIRCVAAILETELETMKMGLIVTVR